MTFPVPLWTIPSNRVSNEQLQTKKSVLFARIHEAAGVGGVIRFASSMAAEDLVVIHAIARTKVPISVFTLNTLRLHSESLEMIHIISRRYSIRIEQILPSEQDVQNYIKKFGSNGFYESVDAKENCCFVRKVAPLGMALRGADAWITGQRAQQTSTRLGLEFKEFDSTRGIPKFNPLFDWTEAEVWSYLLMHSVPIHPLHLKGYPSIGCEPCTRPVRQGENARAGRWWWLQEEKKECGLHIK